jgi:uncharacterized membrane protein
MTSEATDADRISTIPAASAAFAAQPAAQPQPGTNMKQEVSPKPAKLRAAARLALGLGLASLGVAHLTVARQPFQAQVPEKLAKNLPASSDDIVLGSGIIEVALGAALAGLPKERRRLGAVTAAYFVVIFPGNVSQLLKRQDASGLDTDRKRIMRLFFQPLLVLWSLFAGEVL